MIKNKKIYIAVSQNVRTVAPNQNNPKNKNKKGVMCHVSGVRYQVLCLITHVSGIKCQLSPVMGHLSIVTNANSHSHGPSAC